ncbi:dirigent protein 6 [Carya illinoinensis]|uniref:Dirigent protein n=1 Tax=Carya illinoinensis TaxID=32201 RepID=A0A8T1N6A8_CARIL|nr:dirigent protein 6 [Carya illinoinensis]KAG6624800.1 hypothetical protein CIPAW_16G052800 [Carya illinoinensis]KAG6672283.1 hypothetical protein I3842_16G050300 [Carya illinoinensis]
MLPRVVFCTAVSLAILVVVLLALLSPGPHRKPSKNHHHTRPPWLALSLYIQQPQIAGFSTLPQARSAAEALVFHRTLTEGPTNTSRVVGKAQGFIVPVEGFAHSAFNIIYLTFDTSEHSGSLSVEAKHVAHNDMQLLTVVGGTGSFAFARGLAAFTQTDRHSSVVDASYRVKLQLQFPNRSQTVPG